MTPDLILRYLPPRGCTADELLADLTDHYAAYQVKGPAPTLEALEQELWRLEREGKVRVRRGAWVEVEPVEEGLLF